MTTREEAFEQIIQWIREERSYQAVKWSYENEPLSRATDEKWWWENGVLNYWSRVRIYTVTNAIGRQAAAKIITTLVHMLELAIVQYGNLPQPGMTSGEIKDWDRDL